MAVRVERLAEVTAEALAILEEYYEAVGVVVRDTEDGVARMVADPDGGMWMAYAGDAAVGCACLRALSGMGSATECKRLYVRPEARGMGVAQALLEAQEVFARERGIARIYLDSKEDLVAAIALYRRRGFVDCARYNENPQATVFLVKEL